MINLITQQEREMINYYRSTYARMTNHQAPLCSIETLLQPWESAKKTLFKLLGNQLSISKEVKYELPYTSVREDLLPLTIHPFVQHVRAAIERNSPVHHFFTTDYLYTNISDFKTFECLGIVVQKGCKISKILGKIAKVIDEKDLYENFRIEHSRILNQKIISGTLMLSIHPLDYFTMSDNANDWKSCMSWIEQGSYRQGTVEMMNSRYVLVAAIVSSSPFPIGEHSWNSKKWRELFVVTPDIISGIKGYPYCCSHLDKEILNWIAELAQKNLNWTFKPTFCKNENGYEQYSNYNRISCIELNMFDGYMYNDFENFSPLCLLSDFTEKDSDYELCGFSQCMICGEVNPTLENAEHLACENCEITYHCEHCGNTMYEELIYDEVLDKKVCRHCYQHMHPTDRITGEIFHTKVSPYIYRIVILKDGEPHLSYIGVVQTATLKEYLKPDAKYAYDDTFHEEIYINIDDLVKMFPEDGVSGFTSTSFFSVRFNEQIKNRLVWEPISNLATTF